MKRERSSLWKSFNPTERWSRYKNPTHVASNQLLHALSLRLPLLLHFFLPWVFIIYFNSPLWVVFFSNFESVGVDLWNERKYISRHRTTLGEEIFSLPPTQSRAVWYFTFVWNMCWETVRWCSGQHSMRRAHNKRNLFDISAWFVEMKMKYSFPSRIKKKKWGKKSDDAHWRNRVERASLIRCLVEF